MLKIDYPSRNFLDRASKAVENGSDIEIKVLGGFRNKIMMEYLPCLIKNKDQKGKIWKTIFRWFYLIDFISLYGLIMEEEDYYVSYTTKELITILFEKQKEEIKKDQGKDQGVRPS